MAKRKGDYTEILIRQKVISPDQLAEAKTNGQVVWNQGARCPDSPRLCQR